MELTIREAYTGYDGKLSDFVCYRLMKKDYAQKP